MTLPFYRVLSSQVVPPPEVVCLERENAAVVDSYIDMTQLPMPIQAVVVESLWAKQGFDVRTVKQGQVLYICIEGIAALTDGRVTVTMDERLAKTAN